MNPKPYQIGTVVLIEGFNYDEFTIEGYYSTIKIYDRIYTESILYTVRRKDGHLWQVDHKLVRLKDSDINEVEIKGDFSTDELLEMYRNYKALHDTFGDNEYLNKLLEIENRLKNKLSNRR